MLTRRQLLAAAGITSLTSAAAPIAPKTCQTEATRQLEGGELLQQGRLFDLDRAYQVMDEEGLDALIVTRPINFYHFTGCIDHMAIRMDTPSSFAIFVRDPSRPSSVIMNQFIFYYSVADNKFQWDYSVNLFTGWGEKIALDQGPGNADLGRYVLEPFVFKSKDKKLDRAFEKDRIKVLNEVIAKKPMEGSAEIALIKAVKALRLEDSVIGIDHTIIRNIVMSADLRATMIDCDHALRRIRLVKSSREIQLMRIAATANAEAALAAARSIRSGATMQELRSIYFSECALRGNVPVFIQIDTIISDTVNRTLGEGSAFAIDAVSQRFHYTGDYGRTICFGEPSTEMKRATDAIALGWDAIREVLKPGIRYSQIREIGRKAMKRAGYKYDVAVTPHSVGLCHTDEPGKQANGAYWQKDDLVLQENMIISVDMPILHTGIGGSAHLEDLTLITKDGSEHINSIGERLIIV